VQIEVVKENVTRDRSVRNSERETTTTPIIGRRVQKGDAVGRTRRDDAIYGDSLWRVMKVEESRESDISLTFDLSLFVPCKIPSTIQFSMSSRVAP